MIGIKQHLDIRAPIDPAFSRRAEVPRVDVIIPCYNQGRFLVQAIDSVLAQTYPHVGAIVVDDGSTDDTPEVAARYGDRIRLLRKANAGLGAARNSGLLEARGDFVLFMDSDDFLRPDTIEQHMRAARMRPTGTVFYGSCQFVDLEGLPTREPFLKAVGEDVFHSLLAGSCFPCPHTVLVRRVALANVGLFDVWMPSGAEDWDMWIRLAAAGYGFVAVPDAVAMYRRYAGTMSCDYHRMWRSCASVVRRSRSYHPNCELCRKATARANQYVRDLYFDGLIEAMRESKAEHGLRAGLVRAACSLIRNPSMSGRLAREFARYRSASKQ
jgi:glycosyltransferase involved in cell wall biosynthesis